MSDSSDSDKIDRIDEMVREVRDDMKDLRQKLYEGGDGPSWSVRIDRLEQQLKIMAFVGVLFVTSFLTGISDWVAAHMPWSSK